jgi:uncharacterized protein YndB with AHSA1/START domain
VSRKKDAPVIDPYSVVHGTFNIQRRYPVPPARVFFAFSDKATKRRWFVEGEGWEIFDFTFDFRVGGSEMSRFSFTGGPEIRNDTQFQDIVPDRVSDPRSTGRIRQSSGRTDLRPRRARP